MDGIRYLTHNGPVWRALPADFPPAWTIYYRAAKRQADGPAESMHDQPRDRVRELAGRKRYIAVDAMGLLLTVLVTEASIQDRDAARPLLRNLRKAFPSVKLARADGGYAGKLVTWAKTALKPTLQIVRRPDDLHTFQVLPRRWVVGRSLAWIIRHRRTVRDYERLPAHHETCIYWSMIIAMTRRLARKNVASTSAPAQSDAA